MFVKPLVSYSPSRLSNIYNIIYSTSVHTHHTQRDMFPSTPAFSSNHLSNHLLHRKKNKISPPVSTSSPPKKQPKPTHPLQPKFATAKPVHTHLPFPPLYIFISSFTNNKPLHNKKTTTSAMNTPHSSPTSPHRPHSRVSPSKPTPKRSTSG